MVVAEEWHALENGSRWRMGVAGEWESLENGSRWNLIIWVRWVPNLALFVAAFCFLCTHTRQGSNSEPWPLTAPHFANFNFVRRRAEVFDDRFGFAY